MRLQSVQAMGFWPGLPRLWYRGDFPSLLMAILFAMALNMALVATFLWPEWLSPWSTRMLWLTLILVSPAAAIRNYLCWQELQSGPQPDSELDDAFVEAQACYLRGDYFEAEAALHRIFAAGKQDIESAILMISILRRTRRWAQALYCIDRLLLLDGAAPWQYELTQERRSIERLSRTMDDSSQPKLVSEAA